MLVSSDARTDERAALQATRVDVKLFLDRESRIELAELVPVFHGLIQRSAVEDELLIDVADYSHVVDGPGVMLIAHESQYGFEQTKGKTGLLHSQRRARVDGLQAALEYGFRHALRLAVLLQKEEALRGKLRWNGQDVMLRINDRLRAPNTVQAWQVVEPVVRQVLATLLGPDPALEPAPFGPELLTVHARAKAPASLDTLLRRLG
jgi:hypothetical protein